MDEVSHQILENKSPTRKLSQGEVAIYYTAFLKCSACPYVGEPYTKGARIMTKASLLIWAKSLGYDCSTLEPFDS
jgi:hypothetical protein